MTEVSNVIVDIISPSKKDIPYLNGVCLAMKFRGRSMKAFGKPIFRIKFQETSLRAAKASAKNIAESVEDILNKKSRVWISSYCHW